MSEKKEVTQADKETYVRRLGFNGKPVELVIQFPNHPNSIFLMVANFPFIAGQLHKGHSVGFSDQ